MIYRILNLENAYNDSVFVWGARQVGKTTMIRNAYPNVVYYDLLQAKDFERLQRNPSLLGEESAMLSEGDTVVIDEVQKIPQLLDEVHSLMVRKNIRFILSGSSPRKRKLQHFQTVKSLCTKTLHKTVALTIVLWLDILKFWWIRL